MKTMTREQGSSAQLIPLRDLAEQLALDGLAMVRAEAKLAKVRVTPQITSAKIAIVLIGGGAVLSFMALVALSVGLVIALVRPLGPTFAGLAVGGTGLIVAAVLMWLGVRRIEALLAPLRKVLP